MDILNTTNVDASKIVFKTDKPAEPAKQTETAAAPKEEPADDLKTGVEKKEDPIVVEKKPGEESADLNDKGSAGGADNNSSAAQVTDLDESDLIQVINENTGLDISSIDDIQEVFEENKKLKAELENKELTFPSAQAKALYDFAVKFNGNELSAAQNYLQTMSIDLDKIDSKRKQFEAFLLSKPHLDRTRGEAIFNQMYDNKYSEGFESDPLLSFEHEEATRAAEKAIMDAKATFPKKEAESSTPGQEEFAKERIAEATRGIDKVMQEFEGISIAFDETKEGSLSFDLSKEDSAKFREKLINPQSFFNELLEQCMDDNGNIDYGMYASEMFEILNRKKMIADAQKHGFERGKLNQLQELKNTKKPGDDLAIGGGAPPAEKKSYLDKFAEAVSASRK